MWSSPVVLAELEVADEKLVVDLCPQVAGPEEMHTVQVGDVHTPAEGEEGGGGGGGGVREGGGAGVTALCGSSGMVNSMNILHKPELLAMSRHWPTMLLRACWYSHLQNDPLTWC